MRQVPAVRKRHPEDGVSGLERAEVHRLVRLGTGVRLDVHVFGAEKFLRPFDRERLHLIGELAPPVIPFAGIALGVLVREYRALRLKNGLTHVIFRGNENDLGTFALFFSLDRVVYFGVCLS